MALTDSIIAYWKLNEASGNATDSVGSNTLTDNNSVGSTTGKISNCRTFNGTNQKLSIADNADVSFGDEAMSISCWLYFPTTVTGNVPVLGKWDWGTGTDHSYVIRTAAGGVIRFLASPDGSASTTVSSSTTLSPDTWYHVVCYHDPTANTIGIIVNDGTPDTNSHSTGIADGTHAFEMGGSNATYCPVRIDEVGLWGKVLSSQEVTDLYNSGSGYSYPFTPMDLFVHTPTAAMEPCPVWACVDFGLRKWQIGSTTYGWTNTTGSEYSLDVGLSTLGLDGTSAVSNVEVKEGFDLSDAFLTEGSGTGALNAGEWFLDGDTLHVRLSDDTNPESSSADAVLVSFDVGTTGDSEGPQDCSIDWWLTGDTSNIPSRYYQVTDPRSQLRNRACDVRGTAGGTGNGPHGMAFSWILPAGTYQINAKVTNSSGTEYTLTSSDVIIAADTRTEYTVGSDPGDDYSTLAAAVAAQGANSNIRLSYENGHTENVTSNLSPSGNNWVIACATEGGTCEVDWNGATTGTNAIFAFDGDNVVVEGIRLGKAVATALSGTYVIRGFVMNGTEYAFSNCSADGSPGSEQISEFHYCGSSTGYILGLNGNVPATYRYTLILGGDDFVHFVGGTYGPSYEESTFRAQSHNQYCNWFMVEAQEGGDLDDGGSSSKSSLRMSTLCLGSVYGCELAGTQCWVGRTNPGVSGEGSQCVRIEACNMKIYVREDAQDITFANCASVDGSQWWDLGYDTITQGVTRNVKVLHCTGENFRFLLCATAQGEDEFDTSNPYRVAANVWKPGAAVDTRYFSIGTNVAEVVNNQFNDVAASDVFGRIFLAGVVDHTVADVTALNLESWASGNVEDAFTLDSTVVPSSPQTVSTEPGVVYDFFGATRSGTSWAGAVSEAPDLGGSANTNLLLLGVG